MSCYVINGTVTHKYVNCRHMMEELKGLANFRTALVTTYTSLVDDYAMAYSCQPLNTTVSECA